MLGFAGEVAFVTLCHAAQGLKFTDCPGAGYLAVRCAGLRITFADLPDAFD
ncbi:hypothetical protein RAH32_04250 [Paracoccus sp. WLY502]|uniref:hypothetical protein n=1 Tax=Paracoccus yibinensis TaxID=3068891 RepID=UPI0027969F31|nr:hypothetical protein [Paracoccus sp. WLY502]MDQ1899653.1 hypothetical protein [Paracoccus sp. WLY502]